MTKKVIPCQLKTTIFSPNSEYPCSLLTGDAMEVGGESVKTNIKQSRLKIQMIAYPSLRYILNHGLAAYLYVKPFRVLDATFSRPQQRREEGGSRRVESREVSDADVRIKRPDRARFSNARLPEQSCALLQTASMVLLTGSPLTTC